MGRNMGTIANTTIQPSQSENPNLPAVGMPAVGTIMEIEPSDARRQLQAIREFQAVIKAEMVEGHDYGVIPGTNKPTLLKPGAEKMAKLIRCADLYDVEREEHWDKPFFHYHVKCRLVSFATGAVISEGLGSANSYESKWRYRWVFPNEVPEGIDKSQLRVKKFTSRKGNKITQYRVENEDIYSLVNTILKMAKKRALVDAALSAGRLSDLFTQDIEESGPPAGPESEESARGSQDASTNGHHSNGGLDFDGALKELASILHCAPAVLKDAITKGRTDAQAFLFVRKAIEDEADPLQQEELQELLKAASAGDSNGSQEESETQSGDTDSDDEPDQPAGPVTSEQKEEIRERAQLLGYGSLSDKKYIAWQEGLLKERIPLYKLTRDQATTVILGLDAEVDKKVEEEEGLAS